MGMTISSYLFARWHLFWHVGYLMVWYGILGFNVPLVGYLRHQQQVDFDLLTLKVVSESLVPWATSVSILVFLGLSLLNLGPMYATDISQTDVRQHHRLMPPPYGGRSIINVYNDV